MRAAAAAILALFAACSSPPAATPTPTPMPTPSPKIRGYASLPPEQLPGMAKHAAGAITGIKWQQFDQDQRAYTVAITDAAGPHAYTINLPVAAGFPAHQGDQVTIDADSYGGGPNVIVRFVMTDASGGLLLAINRLPPGWKVDYGRELSVDKGDSYDEHSYAARLTPPGAAPIDLTTDWSEGAIGNERFVASATAVKRTLHGDTAPPDYVGSWIDFALIRLR